MTFASGLEMYLHLVKLLEDNYPEMAKRLIVVKGKHSTHPMFRILDADISTETI